MKRIIAGLLAGLCVPAVAAANDYTYFGLNYLQTSYDERGFDTSKPTAWNLRFGTAVNENFAIEARLGSGASKDTLRVDPTMEVDLEIKQLFGVYGRVILPLGERFSVYGLGGITRVKMEATGSLVGMPGAQARVSESDTDLSIGFGADLMLSRNAFANLEYVLLQSDEEAYDLDALSIGLGIRF